MRRQVCPHLFPRRSAQAQLGSLHTITGRAAKAVNTAQFSDRLAVRRLHEQIWIFVPSTLGFGTPFLIGFAEFMGIKWTYVPSNVKISD